MICARLPDGVNGPSAIFSFSGAKSDVFSQKPRIVSFDRFYVVWCQRTAILPPSVVESAPKQAHVKQPVIIVDHGDPAASL
jgi:hypothetical protein